MCMKTCPFESLNKILAILTSQKVEFKLLKWDFIKLCKCPDIVFACSAQTKKNSALSQELKTHSEVIREAQKKKESNGLHT